MNPSLALSAASAWGQKLLPIGSSIIDFLVDKYLTRSNLQTEGLFWFMFCVVEVGWWGRGGTVRQGREMEAEVYVAVCSREAKRLLSPVVQTRMD